MNVKTTLLVTFFLVFLNKCFGNNSIDLIVSFVKLDDRPTSLLLPNLCWNKYELKQLSRSLIQVNVSCATSLQLNNRSEYYLQLLLVIVDLSCPDVERFLIQASTEGYFKTPYRWLLLRKNESLSVLDDIDILVDSDLVLAQKMSDQEYVFKEVYKISENSELIYTDRALWKSGITINSTIPKHGWIEDFRKSKVLSSRRNDLRGQPLIVMNVVADSNETRKHLDDRLNLHQDSISKMSYAVISICFQMLNATERREFTHTWGYKDKNGQWQGLVYHLINKQADLGTQTMFTIDRIEEVDFIAMVGSTAVRFVFREPPLSYISNIFTLPFSWTVWLAIFVCVLGCSVFLYVTSKWEASMGLHPLQLDGSWADVLILIIGAVLQQGCTQEPRYAAGRCVTLLLFVALTILYAAYSANIVVLLRAPSSSVRSLSDLLNSPLKLGASDFEYNRYFFKKLNDPIRKTIYDMKIAPKGKKANFYSMEEGVERIRQGLFAFHMETNPGYRLIQERYQEDEKCDLVEIDYINEINPWVPGQKRSPFKDLFKINFHKIRESGVQSNIHSRLTVPKPRCSGTVSSFSSVGFTDMYPAFLMTLYGVLLAPAVLIMEILYKKVMHIRDKNTIIYLTNETPFPYRE